MASPFLNNADKKKGSVVEFIVVVVIIMVLMKLLLDVFFSQQEKITNTAFNGLAQQFTSIVNVVHGQWLMDEQPNVVVLTQLNSDAKQVIQVNESGWIDSRHHPLACQAIWQQTLAMPLQVFKSPVIALEVNNDAIKGGRLCRFSIASDQYFDYRSDTGKVILVN
ncbi:MAG: hypothetical protein V5789_03740 [Colwellia sp.]